MYRVQSYGFSAIYAIGEKLVNLFGLRKGMTINMLKGALTNFSELF